MSKQIHEGAIFLTAEGVQTWGGYEDLEPLIRSVEFYDFVFLGTGAVIAPLPQIVRDNLNEARVVIEVMATPSACRTYNILLSEGRRVALAALPI